jgi:hypothetical protein
VIGTLWPNRALGLQVCVFALGLVAEHVVQQAKAPV